MPAVSDVEQMAEPGLAQHDSMMPADAVHSSTSELDAAPNAGSDRDVRSLAQMAGATTAVRGPEFNYAITYVNKIKVSSCIHGHTPLAEILPSGYVFRSPLLLFRLDSMINRKSTNASWRFSTCIRERYYFVRTPSHLNYTVACLQILVLNVLQIRVTEKALDETDVFKEVSRLFADHPDLMNDFNKFLPNACATMVRQNSFLFTVRPSYNFFVSKANPGNALTQMTLQNLPATSPSRTSSSQSPPSPPTQPRSSAKPSLVRQQSRSKVERGGSIPTGKPEGDSKQAAKSSKGSEKKLKGNRQKARTEEGAQEGDKQKVVQNARWPDR